MGEMFGVLILGWFLFGPTILIALSRRIHGVMKVIWITGAILPILLAILGVIVAAQAYPESPVHLHSNHFPAALFFSIVGVWGVYIAFQRRHVSGD
jgi:hypothetical protein